VPTSVLDYSSGRKAPRVLPTWSRRTQVFWICVTLAGALILSLWFLLPGLLWHAATSSEALTQADIERIAQIQLPPNIQNLRAHCQSWMGYDLYVRFDIAPNQVDACLEGTLIRRPLSKSIIPSDFPTSREPASWWTPGAPNHFEAGSGHAEIATTMPSAATSARQPAANPETVDQQILIDESNSSRYTVWMFIADGH
jgi:hypothetical protein